MEARRGCMNVCMYVDDWGNCDVVGGWLLMDIVKTDHSLPTADWHLLMILLLLLSYASTLLRNVNVLPEWMNTYHVFASRCPVARYAQIVNMMATGWCKSLVYQQ